MPRLRHHLLGLAVTVAVAGCTVSGSTVASGSADPGRPLNASVKVACEQGDRLSELPPTVTRGGWYRDAPDDSAWLLVQVVVTNDSPGYVRLDGQLRLRYLDAEGAELATIALRDADARPEAYTAAPGSSTYARLLSVDDGPGHHRLHPPRGLTEDDVAARLLAQTASCEVVAESAQPVAWEPTRLPDGVTVSVEDCLLAPEPDVPLAAVVVVRNGSDATQAVRPTLGAMDPGGDRIATFTGATITVDAGEVATGAVTGGDITVPRTSEVAACELVDVDLGFFADGEL